MNGLAGGVLFAGGLVHLLSEAEEMIEHAFEDDHLDHSHKHGYPFHTMFCGVSIICIYLLEQFIETYKQCYSHCVGDDGEQKELIEKPSDTHSHHEISRSAFSTFILWISLSFHSVLEGIGLGATKELGVGTNL
jgi:zinc transporter ZupT